MENELQELKIGDVIWARRYSNKKQKEKIKKNHREGPYIVIKKTNKRIYAIPCTSNKNIRNAYRLGKISTYSKISYMLLEQIEIIGKYKYIRKICTLNNKKINEIMNRINGILKSRKIKNINKKNIIFNYDIGEVIKYKNNKYYIYGKDQSNYKCINLHKKGLFIKSIKINAEKYLLNDEDERILPQNRYYEIIEKSTNIEHSTIIEIIEQIKNNKKLKYS